MDKCVLDSDAIVALTVEPRTRQCACPHLRELYFTRVFLHPARLADMLESRTVDDKAERVETVFLDHCAVALERNGEIWNADEQKGLEVRIRAVTNTLRWNFDWNRTCLIPERELFDTQPKFL
jgi:hypothetical protein